MLGEFANRVAAVEQHALVAVDVGQLRLATRGRGEAGIIGEGAGLTIEFADVDNIGAYGSRQNRALDARVTQGDFGGRFGHVSSPVWRAKGNVATPLPENCALRQVAPDWRRGRAAATRRKFPATRRGRSARRAAAGQACRAPALQFRRSREPPLRCSRWSSR